MIGTYPSARTEVEAQLPVWGHETRRHPHHSASAYDRRLVRAHLSEPHRWRFDRQPDQEISAIIGAGTAPVRSTALRALENPSGARPSRRALVTTRTNWS